MKRLSKLAVALVPATMALTQATIAQEHVFGAITAPNSPMTMGVEIWLDAIDAATEGGYPHNVVSGGALIGKGTEISGFKDGIVDGGFVTMLYYPSELPINNTLGNLNLLAKDGRVAGAAILETVLLNCESCLDELVDLNIMPFGSYATSPYNLFCKDPGNTLADMKGRAIRAVGALGQLADAIGAVPVNLGIGEIYEGIQRGQLACTVFTAGTAPDYSYNDIAPYVTLISAGPVIGPSGLALRYDLWQGMDEKTRKVFIDAAPAAVTESIYGYFDSDANVLGDPAKYKLTVMEPAPDLKAAVDEFASKLVAAKIAELEGKGVDNASEIIGAFTQALTKWEGIVAEVGSDRAAYTAALKREIYDKFPATR